MYDSLLRVVNSLSIETTEGLLSSCNADIYSAVMIEYERTNDDPVGAEPVPKNHFSPESPRLTVSAPVGSIRVSSCSSRNFSGDGGSG